MVYALGNYQLRADINLLFKDVQHARLFFLLANAFQ